MNSRAVIAVAASLLLVVVVVGGLTARFNAGSGSEIPPASSHSMGEALEQPALPPGEADAIARLNASPRHGEWVTIPMGRNATTGSDDSLRAFVVYPMRSDKAPVVIVVHEIFGLTPWIRAVADQLAADGFIAVAPDFITMKNVPGSAALGPDRNQATAVVLSLASAEVNRQVDAAVKYATALPAATKQFGVVGFCWGGGMAFVHAIHSAALGAAVAYYGSAPTASAIDSIKSPILGLFAGSDARVNMTIPPFESAMRSAKKSFVSHTFEAAQHGFLRQSNEANSEASRRAWPLTVQFLKTHLEAR